MKILIIKEVYTSKGWHREGDVITLDQKTANHYLVKGIGVEYKEEKKVVESKEEKATQKRITKKAK